MGAFFLGLFAALGSIWALTIIGVTASIALIICLEHDKNAGATTSFVIGVGAIALFAKWNPFAWVVAHGLLFTGYVALYFVLGTVWAFLKWYMFAIGIRDEIVETGGLTKWRARWGGHYGWRHEAKIPLQVSQHRARVTGWMTYWPWSLTWWVLHDPIKAAWRAIYNMTAQAFQRVSNKVFGSMQEATPAAAQDEQFDAKSTYSRTAKQRPTIN